MGLYTSKLSLAVDGGRPLFSWEVSRYLHMFYWKATRAKISPWREAMEGESSMNCGNSMLW